MAEGDQTGRPGALRTEAQAGAETGTGLLQRGVGPRALVAVIIIAAALGVLAWNLTDNRTESPLEHYMGMGPTVGAQRMQADLLRDFPPGSDAGGPVRRLNSMGLDCAPDPQSLLSWNCERRMQLHGRMQGVVQVKLGAAGGKLTGITVQMERTGIGP